MKKIKIVAIVGPTASGKTGLGITLAKKFNGEIISADSRQVFRGMDIGTGKEGESGVAKLEKIGTQPVRIIEGIPQYIIDMKEPTERFSVAEFKELAEKLIENMATRGKLPIIVGGTHLYVQALEENFILAESDAEELALRDELEQLEENELLDKLKILDPVTFDKIDKKNKRRIVRAIAASVRFGKPFSEQKTVNEGKFDYLNLAIDLPREELYRRIDRRVDDRISAGMIEEVAALLKNVPAERLIEFGLEYKYITLFLKGELTKAEMIEKLKFASHAFARRQLTWLRTQMQTNWVKNIDEAENLVNKFLK